MDQLQSKWAALAAELAVMPTSDDGYCAEREAEGDGTHCDHWWDGEGPCCACGHKPKPSMGGL
jgi:hypothetical protein